MTAGIKKFLQQYTFYPFLLPVFFVFHNYLQYYGLVSPGSALLLLAELELIFVICFLFFTIFTRNFQRSAQVLTTIGAVMLFYGVVKDFFEKTLHIHFVARYIVLLPLMSLLVLLSIVRTIKKNDFRRSNLFQNSLLLVFLLTEGVMWFHSNTETFLHANRLVKSNVLNPDTLPVVTYRPDVYFLVFDSYPGTELLQDCLQYNNYKFDSSLQRRGFYVVKRPRSNYNRTAFSIASTLNFEYLRNLQGNAAPEPKYYNQASLSIEYAAAPAVFIHNAYHIYNLSIFDIGKQPALQKENFLVLPEKEMLLYNTLPERFSRDILWNFSLLQYGFANNAELRRRNIAETQKENLKKKYFNNRAIDSLLEIPRQHAVTPKFVYAHFYLPHPPFFYDSSGNSIDIDFANIDKSMEDRASFLSYLQYTNKVILKLTDTILRNSSRPPVIIIQSDHGYRDFRKDVISTPGYFKNYSAFYFPDDDYSGLYDTLSNINTFPLIFNKYFHTGIPLQKDSSIFMEY